MKKWVENKEPSGAVVHTLVFGHHGDDPKVIVALFRDSEGGWFTTSECARYIRGLADRQGNV